MLWLARIPIMIVLFFNLQCAYLFINFPLRYAPGFDLSGQAGAAIIRGFGILFTMWNVPYAFAAYHPLRNRLSLIQALIMQAIGAAGETILLLTTSGLSAHVHDTVMRFIIFDGSGLILLIVSFLLVDYIRRRASYNSTSNS